MSSRIQSSSVQVGNSFVLGQTEKVDLAQVEYEKIISIATRQAEDITAKAQADAIQFIEAAKTKAQNLIEETRNEAYQQGSQQGYNEGYQNGFNQISNELHEQIRSMDFLAESAFNVKREIIASSEEQILHLTIAIAEKVLRAKLELDPNVVLNIVKAAIKELKDKEEVTIVVNPKLTAPLYNFTDELKNTINGLGKIKIIEDSTIPPDGVIVESADSRIDARLNTQIEEIAKQIISEARRNPAFKEIPPEIEIKIEEPPVLKKRRKKSSDA